MADLGLPPVGARPAIVAQAKSTEVAPKIELEKKRFGLVNTDFSKGLEGWKAFQTSNGVVLGAEVVTFAVKSGAPAKALVMAVGQREVHMVPNKATGGAIMDFTPEGGGFTQTLTVPSDGRLSARFDVATGFESTGKHISNGDGGLFELLVDGKSVARHKIESVKNHEVERGALEGSVEVTAGKHVLSIRVSRGSKPSLVRERDGKGKVTKEVTLLSYLSGFAVKFEAK
jgi:hypothetical protein